MMIRDKNNFFERVKKNHADLAWNYPEGVVGAQGEPSELRAGCSPDRGQAHSWRWTWQGELFGLFVSIIRQQKIVFFKLLRVVVEICRQHFGRLMWRRGRRFGRRS